MKRAATGSEFLARALEGYGTTHVFFVPTVLINAFAEMESIGIKPISAHGEKAAAYMADGYARVAGRPGICLSQAVGDANLMAGLKDAYMAGAPVIAMTGGTYPDRTYRHVYQDIPDFPMFDAVTKWSASVEKVERLPELLRQAYRAATAGAPGPVHLELQGIMGDVVDDEADLAIEVEPRFGAVPPFRPVPDARSLDEATRALRAAKRPVIVAGGGVVRSGAGAALVEFAEHFAIPVATSMNAKAAIPDGHPLCVGVVGGYARRCANEIVSEADLVFFVGSHTGSMVTNSWRTPGVGQATVVHLDIDPVELGRVYPNTIGLMGDARAGLQALTAQAEARTNDEWVARVRRKVRAWRQSVEKDLTSAAVPIRPERIINELSRQLPENAVVVSDTLQASLWTGLYLANDSPHQQYVRCAGSLGWGLPAAIGAKCAAGDRPVICVSGDGGFYYHIAELETAARYGLPIVFIVNNNGAYAGERPLWRDAYRFQDTGEEAADMWTFGSIDFARIARDFGCDGIRVDQPEGIAPALSEALAGGRPTVVDIVTDHTIIGDKGW